MKIVTTYFTLLLFLALPLQALTLDTLEDIGPDGTLISSRVIDGVTVTISTASGPFAADTYGTGGSFSGAGSNGPATPSAVSGERFIGSVNFHVAVPIEFTFSSPVEEFGFSTIDLLENAVPDNKTIALTAFDQGDNVLSEDSKSGGQGPSGVVVKWFVSSSNGGITKAVMTGNIVPGEGVGFGIDDLVLTQAQEVNETQETAVPEASSLTLLSLAGVFLVALVRRG